MRPKKEKIVRCARKQVEVLVSLNGVPSFLSPRLVFYGSVYALWYLSYLEIVLRTEIEEKQQRLASNFLFD